MKITNYLFFTGVLISFLLLTSCLDDDFSDENRLYPNALVTVKYSNDNTVYLQLDDETTLYPVNFNSPPFGSKEVRALVNYKIVDKPSKDFDEAVHVIWIDSIRTKPMALNLGSTNDEIYGNDPIEIVRDWVTIAEDGYLTLRFRTMWGYQKTVHHVNLISTNNPNNPFEVEFRHNANDDTSDRMGDGLVAFKLDKLPDTDDETVKLKLIWKSFTGDKSMEFDYKTNASTPGTSAISGEKSMIPLQ